MGATVTTLNALMGEKFSKQVIRSFDNEPILLNMLAALTPEEVNQRGGRMPVETRRQGSFQGGSENQSMPAPVEPEWLYWTPALKAVYSTGEFSGWAHWQTGINDVNGRANRLRLGGALGEKVASHLESFKFYLDQACFRDGKGKLADALTAVTVGAAGTATVAAATANWTVDDIPIGARVNFYSSAGVIRVTGASISIVTAVNAATGVVTFDTVPTNAAVGDFMVWEASWDLLPNGLAGLIQDQNVTYQGITLTAAYPQLKGNLYQASGAFDIKWVNRMQTRAKKYGGVRQPRNDYTILTHPKQTDAYRNAGYTLNTILNDGGNRSTSKLDLAYNRVSISGMDIHESNNCGERDMFGVRLSGLKRYEVFAPNLLPVDGESQYLITVPSTNTVKHQYQYFYAFYGNILNTMPTAHWRLYDLDKANLG